MTESTDSPTTDEGLEADLERGAAHGETPEQVDESGGAGTGSRFGFLRKVRPATLRWIGACVLLMALTAAVTALITRRDTDVKVTSDELAFRAGVVDTFDRESTKDGLGASADGKTWKVVSGEWKLEQGQLRQSGASGLGGKLVVVDARSPDVVAQVTAVKVSAASGLVFRYRNPQNYWALTAAPEGGTWNVSLVSGGKSELKGRLKMAPVKDGTLISIRTAGNQIVAATNGKEGLVITDPALATETRLGLLAAGPKQGTVTYDNFVAVGQSRNSPLAAGGGAAKGGGGNKAEGAGTTAGGAESTATTVAPGEATATTVASAGGTVTTAAP